MTAVSGALPRMQMVTDLISAASADKSPECAKLHGFVEHFLYFITLGICDRGEQRVQDLFQSFRSGPSKAETDRFVSADHASVQFTFAPESRSGDGEEIIATLMLTDGQLTLAASFGAETVITRPLPWNTNAKDITQQLVAGQLRQCTDEVKPFQCDLRGIDLSGIDLRGADLRGVNLIGANLSGADLSGADLRGAYLRGANLSGAYLAWANLGGANLILANLTQADLSYTDLNGADLSGADLSGAYLIQADLTQADLSYADLRDITLFSDQSDAYLSGIFRISADQRGYYVSVGRALSKRPVFSSSMDEAAKALLQIVGGDKLD